MNDVKNRMFADMAQCIEDLSLHFSDASLRTSEPTTQLESDESFLRMSAALVTAGIPPLELKRLLGRMFRLQAHSFLVMLDGGSQLADQGRVFLKDDLGESVGEGLHEAFYDFLDDAQLLQD